MIAYLIEYHRPTGRLNLTPYEDAHEASRECIRLETERTDPDLELVVIRSDNIETLRSTHARFFMGEDAIIHDLVPANA
ncbi:hypothetical protein KBP53_09595 [Corynebacterium genitalium ATCC 33030]|uniref:Uncharacterized protein n=1 Tax=Corynebacterium genitalium ATCC 33030 TaxID=585529 RepID=D7WA58_9CORY|nr:hypothetical protein [Corynebacterium genitalium]EFK55656.1 hypothetical protein HMPREF0291_10914 [Corynebacterium genitalium ATCC 33030]UUA89124.1 hypothetical protein KBP53_09595 [Corynebacterium genitalium ATCC 33030]